MNKNDLITRMEQAPEGSRELDALCHQSATGCLGHILRNETTSEASFWISKASPSTDMDDADWCINERVLPHYTTSLDAKLPWENIVYVMKLGESRWETRHQNESGLSYEDGIAATEPLARRLAAMKGRPDKEVLNRKGGDAE